MIRPITLVCWILALSAGLYLYRAKHEVELIDQHIDQIAKQTADLRVESRGLLDEWIRLGEPEQLHKYSDEYLGLQPISPGQFARLSDLPARLPPIQPDTPEEQADVVAQSAGDAAAGVQSSDTQPSASQADGVQIDPAASNAANPDATNAADADDIPIPPIPPAAVPVATAAAPAGTALPLQARPVTPRLADGPTEPETTRNRTVASPQGTDELHAGTATMTSTTPGEPHQGSPAPSSGQGPGQPGGQAHGQPPLQAQGPRDVPGLPPLQAQGPIREVAQGPARLAAQGQGNAHPPGQAPGSVIGQAPVLRPAEPHGPTAQGGRQGQARTEEAQTAPNQMPPAQGGSLLGMSRGSVPLPLPAPTPVNANWSGPAGTGPLGSGR